MKQRVRRVGGAGLGKPGCLSHPMEKEEAVSQVKVAPLDVHFLVQVEKVGKDEVSELPNSSANVSAKSGGELRVVVRSAQSLLGVLHWSTQCAEWFGHLPKH